MSNSQMNALAELVFIGEIVMQSKIAERAAERLEHGASSSAKCFIRRKRDVHDYVNLHQPAYSLNGKYARNLLLFYPFQSISFSLVEGKPMTARSMICRSRCKVFVSFSTSKPRSLRSCSCSSWLNDGF